MKLIITIREFIQESIAAAKEGWREAEEKHTRRCSRCRRVVDREPFPAKDGMIAGYYDVQGDPSYEWGCYARPGEKYVCDPCMWADPKYTERRGYTPLGETRCAHTPRWVFTAEHGGEVE